MILKKGYIILASIVVFALVVFLMGISTEPKSVVSDRIILLLSMGVMASLADYVQYSKNEIISFMGKYMLLASLALVAWQGYYFMMDFIDWFLIETNIK